MDLICRSHPGLFIEHLKIYDFAFDALHFMFISRFIDDKMYKGLGGKSQMFFSAYMMKCHYFKKKRMNFNKFKSSSKCNKLTGK